MLSFRRRVILVKNLQRGWEFPGGHREANESHEETTIREAFKETGARITIPKYLGYYITLAGEITIITYSRVISFRRQIMDEKIIGIGLFNSLPTDLSFGDGREELFLAYANQHCNEITDSHKDCFEKSDISIEKIGRSNWKN